MKSTIIRSVLMVLVALFSLNTYAYDVEIEGIYYNLNASKKVATVTKGTNKYTGDVIIPSSITTGGTNYNVTSIGQESFRGCSGLTSVTIPNGVTSLSTYAFESCSGLASVTIPNSVTSIGFGAFQSCMGLTSVTIPNSVTSIGGCAFNFCRNLTSVVSKVKEPFAFGEKAFSEISNQCVLTVPRGTQEAYIAAGWTVDVFKGGIVSLKYDVEIDGIYYNLDASKRVAFVTSGTNEYTGDVIIPSSITTGGTNYSVTSINYSAFYGCSGLTSVTIPNSITSIGGGTFEGCSGLTSVTIPNSVTSIGDLAFYGCSGLTSVTIPNSVTSIGEYAFYGCHGLTTLTIPNSVTIIGESAFRQCSKLASVIIPNSVTEIGENAFADCFKLTSVVSLIEEPFAFGEKAFSNIQSNITYRQCVLTVPYGTKDKYIAAGWTEEIFKGGIVEIDDRQEQTLELKSLPTMTYGANAYTLPAKTQEGLTLTWTSSNANVATISGNTLTVKGVGTSIITATQEGDDDYKPFSKEFTLTVDKAPLTITAKSYTIKQGETLPTFAVEYSGFKNNETEEALTKKPTIACTATSNSAIGTYDITVSGSEANNYNISFTKGTLTITEADPVTVTAKSYTREYGEANPAFEYTSKGKDLEGTPEISCEATKSSPVGTYSIVIKKGTVTNYNDSYVNGTLTITKAPLTITAKDCVVKQGEALPTFEVLYNGFKNDETKDVLTKAPVITCSATSANELGTFDITVSGAEAENYDISYVAGTLTVIDADAVVVTAKNYTREYGEANPTFEYTSEGKDLEGTPEISCEATATSPVGTYSIVVKKGTVSNYNDSYVDGTLTVTKAPLTITAKSYTIKQGEALPTFEVSYNGFKNDETEDVLTKAPVIACSATSANELGTFDITVSGAEAGNYKISYVKGTLTVIDADAVVVTAKSYTREYGEANPTFEYTSEGKDLEGTPEISCEATKSSPVGTYSIVVKKGTVTNYNDSYVDGTLTVTKAPLTVGVQDVTITEGDAIPTFTLIYHGWKNNDTEETALTTKPTATTTATATSQAGTYDITVSGGIAKNYELSYTKGKLTILKKDEPEPIDPADLSKDMYHVWDGCTAASKVIDEDGGGAYNVGKTLSSGVVYGDGSVYYTRYADLTGYNTLLITGTPGMELRVLLNRLEVGNGGGDGNGGAWTELNPVIGTDGTALVDLSGYEFVHLNAIKLGWESPEGIIESLKVSKEIFEQPVTVTANNLTMAYGDNVPALTYKSEGAELNGTPKLSTTATKASDVGTYPIKVEAGTVKNTKATYMDGTLTIIKASLTVGVQDVTITEGDAIPTFTLTYSGWKNSDTEATAFTTKPTATTTATATSTAGTYEITVSGGIAKNYELSYTKGTLTILKKEEPEPTGLVDLSKDMFHVWDGCTATSKVADEDGGGAYNVGETLSSGDVVYGDAYVNYTRYADLTGYNTLLITGTPGMELRVLMNRLEVGNGGGDGNGGAWTELNPVIGTDGTAVVDLSGYEFMHLNAIKLGWNSPEGIIGSLKVSKEIIEQPVTVTANNLTMAYGDNVPALTYKSEGAELNGTPKLSTTATKASAVGTYPIKVEAGTVKNANATYVDGTLTITKASLTVGVQDVTITEGDAIPTFTLTYNGWKNSDTEAKAFTTKPTATTTATANSKAGTYDITVSGGIAKNYELSYTKGTLTILKKEEPEPTGLVDLSKDMFHVWDGCTATSKVADEDGGGAYNVGETLSSGDVVYGDAYVNYTRYADLTGYNTLLITGTPGMELRVLMNRLEVGNGGGDGNGGAWTELNPVIGTDGTAVVDLSGYEFVHLNAIKLGWNSPEGIIGSLKVSKEIIEQPVTVTANNLTMAYGDNVPALTYKSEGAELNGTPKLSTTATKASDVGTYPIKVEAGTVKNTKATYVDGTLTIIKAPLTVGVQDVTITEGDAIPTFTLTYSGWKNSDTEATAFTTKPTATTTATATSTAGTYEITVSGGIAKNYELSYTKGTLTILKKEEPEQPKLAGDANGDGTVNVFDVTAMVNYILGSPNDGFVFEAADVNGDGIVNVFDVTKVVNIILGVDDSEAKTRKAEGQSGTDKLYIEDFEMEPGEEKEVTILLDNPGAEYRDLQFDLYLPEGITVVQDEDEEFMVDTGSRCTKKHTIGFSYTDGHYVCMLYSTAKTPLSSNSGDILTITLKADDNVAPGAKTGSFRNVSLSKTDATGPTYDEFSFGFTVKGEVDAIEDVDAEAAPANKKIFRNGEIIIIRDGKEYDTNGKPVQ